MKKCNGCNQVKPLSAFYRGKGTLGVRSKCKPCGKEAAIAWGRNNPSRLRVAQRKWRDSHPEKYKNQVREQNVRWGAAHPGEKSARMKAWASANRPQFNALMQKRRAACRSAVPAWANKAEIIKRYEDAKRLTDTTGQRWVVDHIVPLQSKRVCGLHVEHNLCVVPESYNASKSNRWWPDMPEAA